MKTNVSKFKMCLGWAGLLSGLALPLAQTAKAAGSVVTYTANPTNGTVPLTVQFGTPANDLNGLLTSWNWTFGDGVGTSTAQNPMYTYTNIGTFTPTLSGNDLIFPYTGTGPSITVLPQISFASTLGSMSTARNNHTATLLPNGLVLIAGGNDFPGTNVFSSAELYNPATGTWTATGSLNTARAYHTATLLSDGLVLVAGGQDVNSNSVASSEIYIPASGAWFAVGSLHTAREYHTATLLSDGTVLVAGGKNNASAMAVAVAEVFNPATFTWTNTGSLVLARLTHTATLLTNGLVLVAAGQDSLGNVLKSAEMYNPASGTWTAANTMNTARYYHTATSLPNGQVLVAGGGIGAGTLTNSELFNPATGTWTTTGGLNAARFLHTATLLPDGRVLVGAGSGGGGASNYLSSAELYNPASGKWTTTLGALNAARYRHTATVLPGGQVLMTGGTGSSGLLASSELAVPATNYLSGTFAATGSMARARNYQTATLLTNGMVLLAGGTTNNGAGTNALASAELYNPITGLWPTTNTMNIARNSHTATLLTNGMVLVAGGEGASGNIANAELFNATTGTWATTGSMVSPRYAHTATLLTNGMVLAAAGFGTNYLSSAELFNPSNGTWTATGSLSTLRYYHTATLLPNGKVLVAGGYNGSFLASAELYNPATGTWTNTGSMANARYDHTATLLPSGMVLVSGGIGSVTDVGPSELYNPATGLWTTTGSLITSRYSHTATLLPNGQVLVTGGFQNSGHLTSAELFNPSTGTWTATSPLTTPRYSHTATLLPNGSVLVAGGFGGSASLSSAELYNVGLGFSPSWQPQITSIQPLTLTNGGFVMVINGSRFRGVSEGSGGNSTQDSPADYPVLQLSSLANNQTLLLSPGLWSNNIYVSTPVTNFPPGFALATAFVNGIPSSASLFNFAGAPAVENFNTLPLNANNEWEFFGNGNTSTYGQTFTAPSPQSVLDDWTFYLRTTGGISQNFKFYLMAWNGSTATGPVLYESGLETVTAAENTYTPFEIYPDVALTSGSQYVMFISTSDPATGSGLNGGVTGPVALAGEGPHFNNGGPTASPLGGQFFYLNNGNAFSAVTSTSWHDDGWGTTGFTLYNANFSSPNGSLGITLTAPTNGQSFFAPATVTLSANVTGATVDTTVGFYNGTNLLGQSAASPYSITVSNLPAGSYPFTAVFLNGNTPAATSAVTHVTVNAPGTSLIDFEAVDASGGPVSGATLSTYLASYGVTVSNVTGGTTLAAQEDQNIFNGAVTKAYSGQNLLTQIGNNGAISYTLGFSPARTSVSWERTMLLAGSGGVATPAWTAYAYNASGTALGQVGENQVFSSTNLPAKSFTLFGPNIAYITFAANNNIGNLNSLPLDNLLLSTNAIGTTPGINLTAPSFSSSAPGSITLSAQAFENGGTISRIDFYQNQVLIGSPATSLSGTNTLASLTNMNLAAGTYTNYAVATDINGATRSSTNIIKTVTTSSGEVDINFDDPVQLPTTAGAVGGSALSNYLASFGVTIANVTLGTRLEAINQNSFSGNELPVPSSLPNLFTQVGSSQPVTFTLKFVTNQEYVVFTRAGLQTNGPSAISHPAWTARVFDSSNNEVASTSEPLIFSTTNIPPRTFILAPSSGATIITSLRFDSDSQGTAAFAAVLLDDLQLQTFGVANPLSISVTSPLNGATNYVAPANIPLSASVSDSIGTFTNFDVAFYSGPTLIGNSLPSASTFTWSNVLNGTYTITARVIDSSGVSLLSAPITFTVQPGGNAKAVSFDPLNASNAPVTGALLTNYFGSNAMTLSSNSPGTIVEVENQSKVAGGGFVTASSPPNVLTQTGSNGPTSFSVGFSNLLTQFSFTRPELLANPFVTQPAWRVSVLDPLGDVLASVQQPLTSSYTNVPAQTYTFKAQGIASVEIDSASSGLSTFPAMLLDDFVLTKGNLILITNPLAGQVITNSMQIPIGATTAVVSGSVTNVAFYYSINGATNLIGSDSTSPFTVNWNAPSNGPYALTAVAYNTGQAITSAPVAVIVASGFAFTSFPASSTIAVGASNVFSVTTTATNDVSYQWQLNGAGIAGATNNSYTITNASSGSAGSYKVVAGNAGLSITSQPPAVLTVVPPPTANPVMQTPANVNIGNTVTLTEMATPTNMVYTYQWQLNGTAIAGATNSSYTISNAQPINSGNYQVTVGNVVAFAQSPTFNVAVNFGSNATTTTNSNFASSIAINPLIGPVAGNNANSPIGGELASIAGKPAGKFLWYNWTASFTGVVSFTTRGSTFDTLVGVYTGNNLAALSTVTEDDDSGGFFTSLVSFNCVQGTTYRIAVAGYKGANGTVILGLPSGTSYRVLDPNSGDQVPLITQQPISQIVQAGANVTLSVTAANASSYQWFFANAPVAGINTSTLVISNLTADSTGNYYALAANDVGAVQSATATIQFQNPAQTVGTPTNLFVDKFGDAFDLTGAATQTRYRPADAGGETGGFTLSQSFSTAGATKEAGEPNIAGQPGGASYWYRYSAPVNGTVQFDTAGSTFNTMLGVYTGPGTSFSSLVNVGAGFTTNYLQLGQPVVLVSNVTSGTTFFIAIDGYLGVSGAAHLNIIVNPVTNVVVSTNTAPITNNGPTITITVPANNFLTISSNITVSGTAKGRAGTSPDVTYVQLAVNTNAFGYATIQATNYARVLVPLAAGGEVQGMQETLTWSSNVTLVPGMNVITAQSINAPDSNTEFTSFPATRTIFYDVTPPSTQAKSILTLLPLPAGRGRITGIGNPIGLEIGKVYKATAVPIGNWVFADWTLTSGTNTNSLNPLPLTNASLAFLMTNNLVLQANFVTNPFTLLTGSYNGLFYQTNDVNEESSGFFTATIPASSRGAFSAKVLLNGGSYPFSGAFDLSGSAEGTVVRSGKTPLTVLMQLVTNGDLITGSVSDYSSNGWSSQLMAYRAGFNARSNPDTNFAGRYTLVIPPGPEAPTNQPGGYGYATLTNNPAGQVVIAGQLGDGTAISQSVPVATNGNIPLYVSLYSRQGSLIGWLNLTNDASNSPAQTILGTNLSWIKISSRPNTLYFGGFTNTNITILGSFYMPTHGTANALLLSNSATLTISNNTLGTLVYSNLTIVGDKLNAAGTPPSEFNGVITPGTGVLTVTFKAPGTTHSTVAKGVVLQNGSTNAAGWLPGTGQTGFFLLQQ